jgi:hypothetical protein
MSGASLTSLVLDQIARHPGATVDDILPHIPHYTRKQVMECLQWQKKSARLICQPQRKAGVTGSVPGRYFFPGAAPAKPASALPANSVFAWGQ